MNTRQATLPDIDSILHYADRIASQHQGFNPLRFSKFPDHGKRLKEYFEAELTNPKVIVSLLCSEDEIVGYSLVKMEEDSIELLASSRAWLHDIFIDEKVRGSGGGKMLLDASKKAAARLGSPSLMLHVASQNSHARKFFEMNGFEESMREMMFIL